MDERADTSNLDTAIDRDLEMKQKKELQCSMISSIFLIFYHFNSFFYRLIFYRTFNFSID